MAVTTRTVIQLIPAIATLAFAVPVIASCAYLDKTKTSYDLQSPLQINNIFAKVLMKMFVVNH